YVLIVSPSPAVPSTLMPLPPIVVLQRPPSRSRHRTTRTNGVGQILPILPKKTRAAMKDFSLKHSDDFLPISKSRRQLSLVSSLTSCEEQRQQPRPWSELLPAATSRCRRPRRLDKGSDLAAARRNFIFGLPRRPQR